MKRQHRGGKSHNNEGEKEKHAESARPERQRRIPQPRNYDG
jgi:hypothetical protein